MQSSGSEDNGRNKEGFSITPLTPSTSSHSLLSPFLSPPSLYASTPFARHTELESLEDSKISDEKMSSSTGNEFIYDKVSNIVNSVYEQLDKMIQVHGESAVKDIMPVIVNILGQFLIIFLILLHFFTCVPCLQAKNML